MTFKNELSLRSSVLVVSKNPPGRPATISFKLISRTTCFNLASPCGSKVQGIKIPSFLRRSVGNKVGLRVDTSGVRERLEGYTRRHPKHLFRRAWGWGYY